MCGQEKDIIAQSLVGGRTKSCGCKKKTMVSESVYKHGGIDDRLYQVWAGIKARCNNKNHTRYKNYGGRGISMCDEWANSYATFKEWAVENGYDPTAQYGKCTIDRIDNNGNYEPTNCRWTGMDIQNKNKRPRQNITRITYGGLSLSIIEWSKKTGVSSGAIRERLRRGWSASDTLTIPMQQKRKVAKQ